MAVVALADGPYDRSWYIIDGGGGIAAVGDDPTGSESDLPLVYRLYDGAPNPFNPRTQAAFDLPRAGHVRH